MTDELTYQNYDDKSLIVFGNKTKYQKNINLIGGRWNSKKNGWIIQTSNKNKLDNLISTLESNTVKKYHREDSDSESSEDIVPIPDTPVQIEESVPIVENLDQVKVESEVA